MNIHKRLQIEFEFLGDEQISGNTALKIINDIFKEAETEQLTIPVVVDSEAELCGKSNCHMEKLDGNVYCSYHYDVNFG
tara:strand:- start:21 stop:257 length:237 start_codon:yes stop_codon:yes gene_type:complete